MNLTEEQLESVRQAGELLIPPTLVAINLEVDEMDFLTDIRTPGTPIHRAYYTGYLNQLTLLALRWFQARYQKNTDY